MVRLWRIDCAHLPKVHSNCQTLTNSHLDRCLPSCAAHMARGEEGNNWSMLDWSPDKTRNSRQYLNWHLVSHSWLKTKEEAWFSSIQRVSLLPTKSLMLCLRHDFTKAKSGETFASASRNLKRLALTCLLAALHCFHFRTRAVIHPGHRTLPPWSGLVILNRCGWPDFWPNIRHSTSWTWTDKLEVEMILH